MRRTTPDLVGQRKTIYRAVSIGLMALTVFYVLWTNYVFFVGGNLPLTSISLGGGSTGAGLTMLFVGDLIVVMLMWFLIDGVVLNLLHMVLRTGSGSQRTTLPAQGQFDPNQPQNQNEPQLQNQWQQGQGQWQQPQGQWQQGQGQQGQWQQGQGQWQQGQGQWQQPQGQWQQGQGQQPQNQWQQNQGQQNQWQPTSAPPPPPAGQEAGGSAQATLIRPGGAGWPPPPGAPPAP